MRRVQPPHAKSTLLLALASSAGLVLALLGDSWLDALAWASLGLPVLAVWVAWLRRTR